MSALHGPCGGQISQSGSLEMALLIDLLVFLVDIVEGWTLNGPFPRSSGWSASTRRRIPGR